MTDEIKKKQTHNAGRYTSLTEILDFIKEHNLDPNTIELEADTIYDPWSYGNDTGSPTITLTGKVIEEKKEK
jgi:hypothetical protein